jgi:hypothetical protein
LVMAKFFARNIDRSGRIFRALCGVGLIIADFVVWTPDRWALCILLAIAGGFVLYEAVRGWCLMRACGIKTKL